MKRVFADTMYWVALASPRDQWHSQVLRTSLTLRDRQIVTTDEILSEFLTHFCRYGRTIRQGAIRYVEAIQGNAQIMVQEQSHQTFLDGLTLFRARPDKGYSLTDCISMVTMRRHDITEALTNDGHFSQEGFTLLL